MAKKPTGLTITRSGRKYICKWKKGQTYTKQSFIWFYKDTAGRYYESSEASLSGSVDNRTITTTSNAVDYIGFKVRGYGKQNNVTGWSAYTQATFDLFAPRNPALTAAWDAGTPNKTTFTFTAKDEPHYPYERLTYQTVLVNDCPADYKAESLYKNATKQTTTSLSGTLFNTPEAGLTGSKTRLVRAMASGQGGSTGWMYKWHVYAQPNAPYDVKTKAVYDPSKGYFDTTVTWKLSAPAMQRPVDTTTIEYMIGVPTAGLGLPTGVSWDPAGTPVNTSNNIWQGGVGEALQEDECLYIRVKAEHDTNHNESTYVIAAYGKLKAPTVSTTPDQGQHKIAVSLANISAVPDANYAVLYKAPGARAPEVLGVLPAGTTTANVIVPPWTGSAGELAVYAFVGTYTAGAADSDGVKRYVVDAKMTSETVWAGTSKAPVIAVTKAGEETAQVTWTWPWEEATSIELSWSDHPDAWESTEQPSTYTIENLHAAQWNIKSLEIGKVWYFRARLFMGEGDGLNYGPYSNMATLDLTAAPAIPVMTLSDEIITADGSTTASWRFVTTDRTTQEYAEIAELIDTGSGYAPVVIASVETQQQVTLDAQDIAEKFPGLNWTNGTQHMLTVNVFSSNNRESGWSLDNYVTLSIAEALTCTIVNDSTVPVTETVDGETITYNALETLPLTVEVSGAGTAGRVTVQIVRAEDYDMERPDGKNFTGYAGQIVAAPEAMVGDGTVTIYQSDLTGRLDDGAQYRIVAAVADNIGQRAEATKDFTVSWTHQAVKAEGTVTLQDDIAIIRPTTPTDTPVGWTLDPGDHVDIYRLSSGLPELLYEGAEFEEDYVDPYPTIGPDGGYRLVFITADGDYIIGQNETSWIDIEAGLETLFQYIDFDGYRLDLKFNVDLDFTMQKTQTVTHYLGGSIQGDTLEGVEGSGTLSGVIPYDIDPDMYRLLWLLGEYTGVCRVRTKQGANYSALVNVSTGLGYNAAGHPHKATLTVTRVDTPAPEGVKLTDWEVSS